MVVPDIGGCLRVRGEHVPPGIRLKPVPGRLRMQEEVPARGDAVRFPRGDETLMHFLGSSADWNF